jgi:hypothetical protein
MTTTITDEVAFLQFYKTFLRKNSQTNASAIRASAIVLAIDLLQINEKPVR